MIKAIVLSAGFGTRLLPLSHIKPKPLFPIVNKTIIDIIINNIKKANIFNIGLNLHYKADLIKSHLKNGSALGVSLYYNYEKEILNTGGGLASFSNFIGDDELFLLHNCDILTNIDISKVIKFHQERKPLVTLVTLNNPSKGSVLVDEKGVVLDIGKTRQVHHKGKTLQGAGIFVYSKDIFEKIPPPKTPYPIIPELVKLIDKGEKILSYTPPPCYWRDIGNITSYIKAHEDILLLKKVKFEGVNSSTPVWIHPESKIEKNVTIQGFASIHKKAKVESNSYLKNTIVWEGGQIKKGEKIIYQVITR